MARLFSLVDVVIRSLGSIRRELPIRHRLAVSTGCRSKLGEYEQFIVLGTTEREATHVPSDRGLVVFLSWRKFRAEQQCNVPVTSAGRKRRVQAPRQHVSAASLRLSCASTGRMAQTYRHANWSRQDERKDQGRQLPDALPLRVTSPARVALRVGLAMLTVGGT